MATEAELKAAAKRAYAAGDIPAAKRLIAAARKAGSGAEGAQAAEEPAPAPMPGPAEPPRAPTASETRHEKYTDYGLFLMANHGLKDLYGPGDVLPQPGDRVGGQRGNARAVVTVQPWRKADVKAARDTFGDTAAKLVRGPLAAAGQFAGGLTGANPSPAGEYLRGQGVPGVIAAPLGAVGDIGGVGLSLLGAGMAGAAGLAAEAVPGQAGGQERKLGEELLGMSQFAVPELAGGSSAGLGLAARAPSMGDTAASILGVGKKIEVPAMGTATWRNAYGASKAKPSLDSLRAAKNEAYKAVDEAGVAFDAPEMAGLRDKVKSELSAGNYVEGVDRQTDAVVTLLDRKAVEKMTLGQMDKLRQEFYKRLTAAPNEVGIRDAIDAIDEMIDGKDASGELMAAARLSNSRYKKVELLDMAMQKAKDQTAATGSGGNILNKMRQAVVSIIDNPKNSKWFSKDEIAAMRAFVEGSKAQNAMRLFGKLSPNGNGLMLALNLAGAAGTGGASLLVTGAATAAKALADRAAIRGAEGLMGKMAPPMAEQAAVAPSISGRASLGAVGAALPPAAAQAGANPYDALRERYK